MQVWLLTILILNYCIFVSHQVSFGKNFYLGLLHFEMFFLENLTLRKIFFSESHYFAC